MDEPTKPVAPAPVAPQKAPGAEPNRKLIIGGIIVVALIALVVIGPMLVKNSALMKEFGDARILKTEGESGSLHKFGFFGLSTVKVPVVGEVIGYAHNESDAVVLVHEADAGVTSVIRLSDKKGVATGVEPKKALALSQDGAWAAYAKFDEAWMVEAVNIESGETTILGTGERPQFLTRDGMTYVFFSSAGGLTVADLAAMTSFTTDFAVASGQASVSPDGAHLVARNVDTGEQGVYSIKAVMPALDLSYLHSVAAPLEYTVFANGNLYGVDGDSIHRLNVSSPEALERVYTFPEGDATYTLIP